MNLIRKFTLSSVLLILVCAWGRADAEEGDESPFDTTLRTHLQAITERDLPALLATVSDRADFSVIFPNGERLIGKAAYETLHKEWFADPAWRMQFTELSRWQQTDMAGVLLRYNYRDLPDPGTGNPRQRYLFLLFERIDGRWLLVHDQNTAIEKPVED